MTGCCVLLCSSFFLFYLFVELVETSLFQKTPRYLGMTGCCVLLCSSFFCFNCYQLSGIRDQGSGIRKLTTVLLLNNFHRTTIPLHRSYFYKIRTGSYIL